MSRIDVLNHIYENLIKIREQGVNIVIRGHPYHMDKFYNQIVPIFREFEIEDPNVRNVPKVEFNN